MNIKETKTCRNCELPKTIDEFQIDNRLPTGHTNLCKTCASEYANDWHKANRDRHNKKMSDWRRSQRTLHPEKHLWASAKRRAKEYNKHFSIKQSDIVVPEVCPIFGVKFEFNADHSLPNSPSLDAIRPNLGYVPGNVAVISHRANSIKQNATPEELRKVADWLEKRLNETSSLSKS